MARKKTLPMLKSKTTFRVFKSKIGIYKLATLIKNAPNKIQVIKPIIRCFLLILGQYLSSSASLNQPSTGSSLLLACCSVFPGLILNDDCVFLKKPDIEFFKLFIPLLMLSALVDADT